jgi:putative CocE/NonD family hydrolase
MSRHWVVILILVAILGVAGLYAIQNRMALVNALPMGMRDAVFGMRYGYEIERNVMVAMPDGVKLATNLYFPRGASGRLPTILARLPYDKDTFGEAIAIANQFAAEGYVVAVQDVRGKFASEGVFTASRFEAEDGSATIDWIAAQSWSNGRVGTVGCSALGEAQILLSRMRNPHHVAMNPSGAGGAMGSGMNRYTYFGQFEGGIFQLASGFGWFLYNGGKRPDIVFDKQVDVAKAIWELPSGDLVRKHRSDPTDYDDFVSRPLGDPYWRSLGFVADEDRFATPALVFNTWQDQTVAESLALADLMKRNATTEDARRHHHVIIGPGNHCQYFPPNEPMQVGELPLGPNARIPFADWQLAWFDHWLKGTGALPPLPPYRFYIIGEDRWLDSEQWPPAAVKFQSWYLDGDGPANSAQGKGRLTPSMPASATNADEFTYDPMKPVRTRGGPICCTGNPNEPQGPVDQKEVEARHDVLVYTSDAFEKGLRIVGPLRADLHITSSAKDTDFTAKLVDVWPDGRALNIQEGALRMRYRDSFTDPQLMTPGEVYKASIDLRAIAYYLPPGHRLRLQISSSNFPRLERNLNTGGRNHDESVGVVAVNRVLRTADHPSAVILPVLETE